MLQYKDDKICPSEFLLQKIIIFHLSLFLSLSLLLHTYLYVSSLISFFALEVRKCMNSTWKANLDSYHTCP